MHTISFVDGIALSREPSNQEGWLERLDTRRSAAAQVKPASSHARDVEKAAAVAESDQQSEATTVVADPWEVRWGEDDFDNPRNFEKWRKWACVYVVSSGGLCV